MKKNTRHLLKALLSVLALTMLLCMPASAASEKTVATIGEKSYTTMSSAIKAVKNGQTIKLQKDLKIKCALNSNKKYTINLNGHTLTGTYKINDTRIYREDAIRISAGTVTVKNGAVTGFYVNKGAALTVENLKTDPNDSYWSTLLYIKKGAKVKIKSGSEYGLTIYNYGNLTINKMTIESFRLINESSGKTTIKGGTFSNNSSYSYGIENAGKLTISGGTFKNFSLNNYGDMTIFNGKFTYKEHTELLYNSFGKATIKGGTFKSTNYDTVIRNHASGTLKITGGTFKSTGTAENLNHASMGTIVCSNYAKTTITGGTISNKYSNGIYVTNDAGSFKCSGAKITVSSSKMKKIRYE